MDKTSFLIVGGTDGIGRALANILAEHNRVIILGRSQIKGQTFLDAFGDNVDFIQADVSIMSNVDNVCSKIIQSEKKLDFIIHTADVLQTARENTREGLEKSIAINLYSRVLFNELLLKKFQPERIIHVAAAGFPMNKNFNHKFPVKDTASGFSAHGYGQIANDFYGLWMSKKLKNTKINILNPGIVDTDIRRNAKMGGFYKFMMPIMGFFMLRSPVSPETYAQVVLSIIKNQNDESNRFVLINKKGEGISGNKNINDVKMQQYVYESTIN
ncbi:MAG: SDR family NAD(P)-dependent oxidoreductase, partial [Bacteroidota bacterium]